MECRRCLYTDKEAKIKEQCEYCDLHDELERQAKEFNWPKLLKKIRSQKRKYDCLIGISGGADSSIMLYLAVRAWKLNPLVIHFDNFWNTEVAENNIKILVENLNVDFIRYSINKRDYDTVCKKLLLASVPDGDIANDMAMAYFMMKTADQYKIKYIFNGHDFRTEGSSPTAWSYMDAKYLKSICGDEWPESFPMLTFNLQLWYFFKGITQVRPLYYYPYDSKVILSRLRQWGWKDYGGKHCENIYTEFIGSYLLPRKFHIDKRITYESALIRSNLKKKTQVELYGYPIFDESKLLMISQRLGINIRDIMLMPIVDREKYEKYNFRRFKPLLWILMKIGIIPLTFYRKYTK